MHMEVELKLEVEDRHIERLKRHAIVRRFRQGRAITQELDNTYFDTPDLDLANHAAALRIRRHGRHYIQTLKMQGEAQGAHFARPEWEWDLSSPQLDFSLLTDTPVASLLADKQQMEALQPLFQTIFKRTTWLLGEEDWAVELTIDRGSVISGQGETQRSCPIREVELELKKGDAHHIYDVALALTEGLPCHLLTRSKAARGYALAQNLPETPYKSQSPALNAEMSVADAFRRIGQGCLYQALSNEPLVRLDRHPEAVHQMRVALRRLRSALSLFKPITTTPDGVRLKEELRWLANSLGQARDLDVFADELLRPVQAVLSTESTLSELTEATERHRHEAYEGAVAALSDPRTGRLMLDLAAWLDNGDWSHPLSAGEWDLLNRPIKGFARDLLDGRADRVLRRGKHFLRLSPEKRHALRIEVKKLRYACEFLISVFPSKKGKAYMKTLSTLQDQFGHLNDAVVAYRRMRALALPPDLPPHLLSATRSLDGTEPAAPATLTFACGLVSGWHQHAASQGLQTSLRSWQDFTNQQPFWK